MALQGCMCHASHDFIYIMNVYNTIDYLAVSCCTVAFLWYYCDCVVMTVDVCFVHYFITRDASKFLILVATKRKQKCTFCQHVILLNLVNVLDMVSHNLYMHIIVMFSVIMRSNCCINSIFQYIWYYSSHIRKSSVTPWIYNVYSYIFPVSVILLLLSACICICARPYLWRWVRNHAFGSKGY